MPIEVGLWRVGEQLTPVAGGGMDSERRLETLLANDIKVVDQDLMLIGRQVSTEYGKYIDLLALDSDGRVVVLESKKDRSPREVVAQLLDYGSWVRDLEEADLDEIFRAFQTKHQAGVVPVSLHEGFRARFDGDVPGDFNEAHKLVLVASGLDDSSERIINYLADEYAVSINAVFFKVFRDADAEYLSRAWLADPEQIDEKTVDRRRKLPWNGEYYASFGADEHRDWEEARRYGFISAGGGEWYTRTLSMLEPGGRVWVNIPKVGYVGVGRIVDAVVPIDDFEVDDGSGQRVPISSLPLKAQYHSHKSDNPELTEHFVRVEWIKTVPVEQAIREKGLFGNQNSAAQPRTSKWQHTVETVAERLGVEL